MRSSSGSRTEGRRGGGWVLLQVALMAAVLGAGAVPPRLPDSLRLAGVPLIAAGAAIAIASARALGRALTPFPRPRPGGRLVTSGPYGVVRHPIYAAGLLCFAGYALVTSLPALAATVALGAAWYGKAAVEERLLAERHPEYQAYARRTRRRFVPWLL